MKTFKQFLEERYVNLFTPEDIEPYAEKLHKMAHDTYADKGGLAASGFESPHALKTLPMIKVHKKNGEVIAASFYKDKDGRKAVATAHDGSTEGKKASVRMLGDELDQNRSYAEVSKAPLALMKRKMGGDVRPIAHPFDQAVKQFPNEQLRKPPSDDPELIKHPELSDHLYQRQLGDGEWHTKLMVGAPGKKIVR